MYLVGFYEQAEQGKRAFSTGAYTDVRNPRKAQFNAVMRRSEEATALL